MLNIKVRMKLDPALGGVERLKALLGSPAALNEVVRPGMDRITKQWVSEQAQLRHATATRLGGTQTGELARAATKITSSSDADAARVESGSPLLGRAIADVTIKPGAGKTYLTIAIAGESYGKRIAEFERNHGKLRFLGKPGGKAMVAALFEKGAKIGTAHYLLVKEVHQKQARDLLPSDKAYYAQANADLMARITREWEEKK